MTNYEKYFGTPEIVAENFGAHMVDGKCSCLKSRYTLRDCNDCRAAANYKNRSESTMKRITLEWLQEEAS